jgi:hypothetical protein
VKCSICQKNGHNRTAHYARCAVCGKDTFFTSVEEMLLVTNDQVVRKQRTFVCSNKELHEEMRMRMSSLPEGAKGWPRKEDGSPEPVPPTHQGPHMKA